MHSTGLNIAIALALGFFAYAVTLYLDHRPAPRVAQGPISATQNFGPGQLAPDFAFTAMDGKSRSLHDFRGKMIVLNFWASWCAPCLKEFPDLLRIAASRPYDIVFIALSSDTDRAAMERFLTKLDNGGKASNVFIALDTENITLRLYGTSKLPETFLIDRELKARHKLVGASWEKQEVEKLLSGL
jgi:cytochrome c biogenesis protein CcmG/thiol:disulfide interchange protein DsbE